MAQSDFMTAINQIAAERNIDPEEIFDVVKQAIKTTFKKDFEDYGSLLHVELDPETSAVSVFAEKKVVEEVSDEQTQISLKDARKLESKLKVGDHIEIDITPQGDFGRVAAQTVRQVILQKLREVERDMQIKRFKDRMGDVENAYVQRLEKDTVIWTINNTTVFMPPEERVQNEFYRKGARHKVLLKEIVEDAKGKRIIVSRSDDEFIRVLFMREIPELESGTIEIKQIAREAGNRAKIAVSSNSEGIDPIGACVGQRGSRIMEISNELRVGSNEEKLDIIMWDEDPIQFVINSLSPSQVIKAEIIDEEEKKIRVIVVDDQLSLAIGKEGQNARLASKLTGWTIDVQGETIEVEDNKIQTDVENEDAKVEDMDEQLEDDDRSLEEKNEKEDAETKEIEDAEEKKDVKEEDEEPSTEEDTKEEEDRENKKK